MTQPPGRCLVLETEVKGVYELINTFWITSSRIDVKEGSLTVIAENLAGKKFVVEGAGAIDLLSALGVKVPPPITKPHQLSPEASPKGQNNRKRP
jgi:hypothetical protein